MCGITGIFHRRDGRPDERVLDAMTDRLEHRGPDARGTYVHEGVGFGHRRLSIIGISDGVQPMCNEDGTVWVTYNGEIYNYQELKAQLVALGHTFKTGSDTEVIVHGYEAWGYRVAERLRGIYAFAIHDQKTSQVVGVRDRLGVKPFYYRLTADLLLFASEPKALLLHPDTPKRPDLDAINLYLRAGYVPAPYAAFEGMKQLEAGHLLVVTPTGSRVDRYWRPGELGTGAVEQVADTLDRLIDESVSMELMSEVPLGAFLSGGVDSSAVAASMARTPGLAAAPRTFCVGFPQPEFDESGHSRVVADQLKLDHTVDMISIDDLNMLDRLVDVYDEPFADASALPTYALCAMAKKYVTVALSGDGGDEVFAGYRRYNKLAKFFELPRLARKLIGTAVEYYPSSAFGARKMRLYASKMGMQYELDMSVVPQPMIPELMAPELVRTPDWSIAGHFDEAPGDDPILKAQWCDLMTYLPGDILVKVDRASMAHALEVRVPLLDHVLVEWACKLPIEQTFADGKCKVALKDHLARRIPREMFERPKMGFGVPLTYWLGGENGLENIYQRLRDRGPGKRLCAPILPGVIPALMERHAKRDSSVALWALLFLETWWQKHFS